MRHEKERHSDTSAQTEAERELPAASADESGEASAESLRRVEAERDDLRDRWLRARADLDNQRKRASREAADQRAYAAVEAVRAFLPVLDGIELALLHQTTAAAEFRTGVEMIKRQLEEALRRLGIEPIEAVGRPFDPHLHEAIEMVETDSAADGTVVGELQRGFRMQERLIRPARVKVAKKPM